MTTTLAHTNVPRSHPLAHALATLVGWARRRRAGMMAAQPQLSAVESARLEAQRLRQFADTFAISDRGFASDLYAAALRHERLHGVD